MFLKSHRDHINAHKTVCTPSSGLQASTLLHVEGNAYGNISEGLFADLVIYSNNFRPGMRRGRWRRGVPRTLPTFDTTRRSKRPLLPEFIFCTNSSSLGLSPRVPSIQTQGHLRELSLSREYRKQGLVPPGSTLVIYSIQSSPYMFLHCPQS